MCLFLPVFEPSVQTICHIAKSYKQNDSPDVVGYIDDEVFDPGDEVLETVGERTGQTAEEAGRYRGVDFGFGDAEIESRIG